MYGFNFYENVTLNNIYVLDNSDVSVAFDDYHYEWYNSQIDRYESFSKKSLICGQEIYLNETSRDELMYYNIDSWLSCTCKIRFRTNPNFTIHFDIIKHSNNFNNYEITDEYSNIIEPIVYTNKLLYIGSILDLQIRCTILANKMCSKRNFYIRVRVLSKMYELIKNEKLNKLFDLEKNNDSLWTYNNITSSTIRFNYTPSSRESSSSNVIVTNQVYNKTFWAVSLNLNPIEYYYYSDSQIFLNLKDVTSNQTHVLWSSYVKYLSRNFQLVASLDKNVTVPEAFKIEIKIIGYQNQKLELELKSLLVLPRYDSHAPRSVTLRMSDSFLKRLHLRTWNPLPHVVNLEILQSYFTSIYANNLHSIFQTIRIERCLFYKNGLSIDLNFATNLFSQPVTTSITLENNIFLLCSITNYIRSEEPNLVDFHLANSQLIANNGLLIEGDRNLNSFEIVSNIFLKNYMNYYDSSIKFYGNGKITSNLFKENLNRYYDYLLLFSVDNKKEIQILNNSFIGNSINRILYAYSSRDTSIIALDNNWWDTRNVSQIINKLYIYNFKYKSLTNESILDRDPELFQTKLCTEGWFEWNGKCFKQILTRLNYDLALEFCQNLDANLNGIYNINEFLLMNQTNTYSFWFNSTKLNDTCLYLVYDNSAHNYTLSNSSCFERKSVICEKPLCPNLNECNKKGKCIAVDKCKCFEYSMGDACDKFFCEANCTSHGKCIGPNSCKCDDYWSSSSDFWTENGYKTKYCSMPLCTNSCNNRGICVDANLCKCKSGYTGFSCENFTCDNECKNGADCIGPNTCNCTRGWTGSSCDIPSCQNDCNQHGTCVRLNECNCHSGYYGQFCEKFDCLNAFNCSNNGKCIDSNVCKCYSNWVGQYCEKPLCPNGCNQRGDCITNNTCKCYPQFTGSDCSQCSEGTWSQNCLTCPPCVNGVCSKTTGKCVCISSRWSGELCNRCSDGYAGNNCNPVFTISFLTPDFGSYLGGTTFFVNGFNFPSSNEYLCKFDNFVSEHIGILISPNQVKCVSPKHVTAGPVLISIKPKSDKFVTWSSSTSYFNYIIECQSNCGSNFNPSHGVCILGTCKCFLPWSGEECSILRYSPEILKSSLSTSFILEGRNLTLKLNLVEGSQPISWKIQNAFDSSLNVDENGLVSWLYRPIYKYKLDFIVKASNDVGDDYVTISYVVTKSYVTELNALKIKIFFAHAPPHGGTALGRYFRACL